MIKLTEKEEFTRRILKKMQYKMWFKTIKEEEEENRQQDKRFLRLAEMTDDAFNNYVEHQLYDI